MLRRALLSGLLVAILAAAWTVSARAQTGFGDLAGPTAPADANFTLVPAEYTVRSAAGATARAVLTITCPEGGYVWATSFSVGASGDLAYEVGDLELPPARQKIDPWLNQEVDYLDGTFDLAVPVRVPRGAEPGDRALVLDVTYNACTPELCTLQAETVELTLRVEPGEPPAADGEPGPEPEAQGGLAAAETVGHGQPGWRNCT